MTHGSMNPSTFVRVWGSWAVLRYWELALGKSLGLGIGKRKVLEK